MGSSAQGTGVSGRSDGTGIGVSGASPSGTGVSGASPSGIGVSGASSSGSGVMGSSAQGTGVSGRSDGTGAGVIGSSAKGAGVLGQGDATGVGVSGTSPSGVGVSGTSPSGTGVSGTSGGTGPGVMGSSANGAGVLGRSDGSGSGVSGTSAQGAGVSGTSGTPSGAPTPVCGVWGDSDTQPGVVGTSRRGNGVQGTSSGRKAGVLGIGDVGAGVTGSSARKTGVIGTGLLSGVQGTCDTKGSDTDPTVYAGVFGRGADFGVAAVGALGLRSASTFGSGGTAGIFEGGVEVHGHLSTPSGGFQIDHPRDLANSFLNHFFVESPDMLNVYNGNVTTNTDGNATVELPGYFESLNRDFCYQLTVIGQFAQAIVSEEFNGNHFTIKTDKPNVTVSWQVTGIRQDAWAKAHRVAAEVEKPVSQRGKYLTPLEHGQPATMGIRYAEWSQATEETEIDERQT